MLRKFYLLLDSGGSVLMDVYLSTAFREREETAQYEVNLHEGFWSPNRYYGFLNTFKYEEEKVILDKYTIVEATGMRTVYNWLQYFSAETLKMEPEDCGFDVDQLSSDVAGSPSVPESAEFAVIAKKPW